ncbi:MAG: radical SAM protein [Magnetococcales bacterium]|nr:radical SAM protein [Magnetococcales bacterium]
MPGRWEGPWEGRLEKWRDLLFNPYLLPVARPYSITVETINTCNAKCIFCPYPYNISARERGIMSMPLFRKIVDDYAEWGGGNLCLTPITGEILIDKHLEERIDYARSLSPIKTIEFYTNGLLLDGDRLENLFARGVTRLFISVAGHDRESYRQLMGVDRFQRFCANLEAIHATALRLGRLTSVTIAVRTQLELESYRQTTFYREHLQRFPQVDLINRFSTWGNSIELARLPIPLTAASLGEEHRHRMQRLKCPCAIHYGVSGGMMITWNGVVSYCGCRDFMGNTDLVIGDASRESLVDIWKSPAKKRIVAGFERGEPPLFCQQCDKYTPMTRMNRLQRIRRLLGRGGW